MLDKRSQLIENLTEIKNLLLRVKVIEENGRRSLDYDDYNTFMEHLHYETLIINEVKKRMKDIIPDLVYYKNDRVISDIVRSIENINELILKLNIGIQGKVKNNISFLKKRISSINNYSPKRECLHIVDIRA